MVKAYKKWTEWMTGRILE